MDLLTMHQDDPFTVMSQYVTIPQNEEPGLTQEQILELEPGVLDLIPLRHHTVPPPISELVWRACLTLGTHDLIDKSGPYV